jgi:hypothetical protein
MSFLARESPSKRSSGCEEKRESCRGAFLAGLEILLTAGYGTRAKRTLSIVEAFERLLSDAGLNPTASIFSQVVQEGPTDSLVELLLFNKASSQ